MEGTTVRRVVAIAALAAALGGAVATGTASAQVAPAYDGCGVLLEGQSGPCVVRLQDDLKALNSTLDFPSSGFFGEQTRIAVLDFQGRNDLDADGNAGPQVQGELIRQTGGTGSVPADDPAESPREETGGTSEDDPTPRSDPASRYPEYPVTTNCTQFGKGIDYKGVGLREGFLCTKALRDGLRVEGLHYNWEAVRPVCNWRVQFDIVDAAGDNVYSDPGEVVGGCRLDKTVRRFGGELPVDAPAGGVVCATLYKSGSTGPNQLAKACEPIF